MPEGYIAVIRGISLSTDMIAYNNIYGYLGLGAIRPEINFYINGILSKYVKLPQLTPEFSFDTNIIIPANGDYTITLTIRDQTTPTYNFLIAGNYILSDGLPANFEIGTKRIK